MRRFELECNDPALLAEVAAGCEVGYLALTTPDGPRAVALNFAVAEGAVWYHGAMDGEKFEVVAGGARAGFTMVLPHSLIPSYWSAPDHACPGRPTSSSPSRCGAPAPR